MTKKHSALGSILRRLLFERSMRPSDLARAVQMPVPTVHRLVTSKSTRPYKRSLQPIADYFSISIEQLLGEVPLREGAAFGVTTTLSGGEIQLVPLIAWDELGAENQNGSSQEQKRVPFIGSIGRDSFATLLPDSSMEPQFTKGNILIFDPHKAPTDRSYVLVKLAAKDECVFRQLLIDVENKFLKPLNPDLSVFKMRLLATEDLLLATLVEARQIYKEV